MLCVLLLIWSIFQGEEERDAKTSYKYFLILQLNTKTGLFEKGRWNLLEDAL